MANYNITQLTEGEYLGDRWFPINVRPSISYDGSRIVFASKLNPEMWGHSIMLYERNQAEPRRLSVLVDGTEQIFLTTNSQISGDGQKIIFADQGYLTEEDETGIYVYDIDSETIRLVVKDIIPRYPSGVSRPGEPGEIKHVNYFPSISENGRYIAYLQDQMEYSVSSRTHWRYVQTVLNYADISSDRVRGDVILKIKRREDGNPNGHGFSSIRISGDGRYITFYAGGVVEGKDGLGTSNLEMPPFETQTSSFQGVATCNVYCYIVRIRGGGHYRLGVVPEPGSLETPLVVAHPKFSDIQSFRTVPILYNPPSISSDGSLIATSLIMAQFSI